MMDLKVLEVQKRTFEHVHFHDNWASNLMMKKALNGP